MNKHGLLPILAATFLLCSCSTLTPDRIAVLAALAGNAAQIGIELWLKDHPQHRGSVEAILAALSALSSRQAVGAPSQEELLSSLPTHVLTGPRAEAVLYIAATNLVVVDKKNGKPVVVEGTSREPVLRSVRDGLRRALVPLPPMPGKVRVTPTPAPRTTLFFAPTNNTRLEHDGVYVTNAIPSAVYALERQHGTNWLRVKLITNSAPSRFQVLRIR